MYKPCLNNIEYTYNESGLVTQIKQNGTPKVNILYDDKGKRYKKETNINETWHETYYVRDASGQVMAIYNGNYGGSGPVANPKAEEYPIYGSSRLGIAKCDSTDQITSTQYQFTYHLGNVRAVVNDNEVVTNYADYYPFGMQLPERILNGADGYRYGYQGEFAEKEDPESTGTTNSFELRLWDARIGRWLTADPYGQYASPYLGMGNNPINGVDPDGVFFGGYKLNDNGDLVKISDEGDDIGKDYLYIGEQKLELNQGILKDGLNIQQDGYETNQILEGIRLARFLSFNLHKEIAGVGYSKNMVLLNPHLPTNLKVFPYDNADVLLSGMDSDTIIGLTSGVEFYFDTDFQNSLGGKLVFAFHTHPLLDPSYLDFASNSYKLVDGHPRPSRADLRIASNNIDIHNIDIPYYIFSQRTGPKTGNNASIYYGNKVFNPFSYFKANFGK